MKTSHHAYIHLYMTKKIIGMDFDGRVVIHFDYRSHHRRQNRCLPTQRFLSNYNI